MWLPIKPVSRSTRRAAPSRATTARAWVSKRALVLIAALLVTWPANLLAQPADVERQLRVFAPQTTYVVPIVEHDGTLYVGLFEVLEPLGRVESHFDQPKWKLKF